jgi:hypothetical protein
MNVPPAELKPAATWRINIGKQGVALAAPEARCAAHKRSMRVRCCAHVCGQETMMEVCTIAPLPHEPGLVAYECTHCGPVTTELQRPIEGQSCLFPKA